MPRKMKEVHSRCEKTFGNSLNILDQISSNPPVSFQNLGRFFIQVAVKLVYSEEGFLTSKLFFIYSCIDCLQKRFLELLHLDQLLDTILICINQQACDIYLPVFPQFLVGVLQLLASIRLEPEGIWRSLNRTVFLLKQLKIFYHKRDHSLYELLQICFHRYDQLAQFIVRLFSLYDLRALVFQPLIQLLGASDFFNNQLQDFL